MSSASIGNIVLVIKTPQQRIADYQVEVNPHWTIAELKEHLSTQYPSQPAVSQQKLIYAGQLMKDSLRLDSILKDIDQNNVHTIHLVCASNNPPSTTSEPRNDSRQEAAEVHQSPSAQTSTNENVVQSDAPSVRPSNPTFSSANLIPSFNQYGLPFYASQPNVWYTQFYEYAIAMQQQYYAAYFEYLRQQSASSLNLIPVSTLTPQSFAEAGTSRSNSQSQPAPSVAAPEPANANAAAPAAGADAVAAPVAAAAPAQAPGADPRVLNAQGGVDDGDPDNDGAPNDWFDLAYTVLKLALLISMFYSYSTWDKLAIGLGLFVLVYALQRGVNRAGIVRPPPAAAPVAPEVAAMPAAGENERGNLEGRADPPLHVEAENQNNGLSSIKRVCTRIFDTFCAFFITFITSLLPERAPPLAAN